MRWKITIIALSALAAVAFGLGTKTHPQRPVLHDLQTAVTGG